MNAQKLRIPSAKTIYAVVLRMLFHQTDQCSPYMPERFSKDNFGRYAIGQWSYSREIFNHIDAAVFPVDFLKSDESNFYYLLKVTLAKNLSTWGPTANQTKSNDSSLEEISLFFMERDWASAQGQLETDFTVNWILNVLHPPLI